MLLAKMSVIDDVRVAERRELVEETTIRLDERPVSVDIFNLSATGCLLRTEAPLRMGAEVRIGLPGVGAFHADVVRTRGTEAGCRFRVPLTAEQLDRAFHGEVVVDGSWASEMSRPAENPAPSDLPARAKLAWIVGLSCGLWALIAAAILSLA